MVGGPAQYGTTALTLRCTKGDGKPGVSRCMPGAGLSLWRPGRPRLTGQPSSRTEENPPYGMSGGIEETSASFEARSAPRPYPTPQRAGSTRNTTADRLRAKAVRWGHQLSIQAHRNYRSQNGRGLVRYPVVQVRPGVRLSPGHLGPGRRDQDDVARLEDRDVLGGQPPQAARPTAEDPVRHLAVRRLLRRRVGRGGQEVADGRPGDLLLGDGLLEVLDLALALDHHLHVEAGLVLGDVV